MVYEISAKNTITSPDTVIIPEPTLSDKYPPIGENTETETAFKRRKTPRTKDEAPIISPTKYGRIKKLTKDPIYRNKLEQKPPPTVRLFTSLKLKRGSVIVD